VGRTLPARAARGLLALGVPAVAYLLWLRPWQQRWGATDDEVYRPLPGDEVVHSPTFDATRAVTVEARPEQIWPWIVQIGFGRAGWYSYDWLDNLGRPSSERVVPEWQQIEQGSYVPMGPGENMGMGVRAFEANRWVLWGDRKGDATWLWMLHPEGEGRTRLITRVRMRYRWTSPTILFSLLVEFADIFMMRKSLLGIKARAERGASPMAGGRGRA
jgi:hypothetical protein